MFTTGLFKASKKQDVQPGKTPDQLLYDEIARTGKIPIWFNFPQTKEAYEDINKFKSSLLKDTRFIDLEATKGWPLYFLHTPLRKEEDIKHFIDELKQKIPLLVGSYNTVRDKLSIGRGGSHIDSDDDEREMCKERPVPVPVKTSPARYVYRPNWIIPVTFNYQTIKEFELNQFESELRNDTRVTDIGMTKLRGHYQVQTNLSDKKEVDCLMEQFKIKYTNFSPEIGPANRAMISVPEDYVETSPLRRNC